MSPLYDYMCDEGHVTEEKAGYEIATVPCPSCGRDARRLPVYESQYISGETVAKGSSKATRAGNLVDKHGRTRLSIFQEATAEVEYAHKKTENEVGHELPPPPLWEEGLKRARKIKGGEVLKDACQIKETA
jgi:hypothetical protein